MESDDVGVNDIVRLFNNTSEDSRVIVFDIGPMDGLYPNPDFDTSFIVSFDKDETDGSIISSFDMISL